MLHPPAFVGMVPGLAASMAFFSAMAFWWADCWLLQELSMSNMIIERNKNFIIVIVK
jgi:hypothetical protein